MKHFTWRKTKPKFTEACLLLVASHFKNKDGNYYEYTLFEIVKLDGYAKDDTPAWYWGVVSCPSGEEWGDIGDLKADLYFTMPRVKSNVLAN